MRIVKKDHETKFDSLNKSENKEVFLIFEDLNNNFISSKLLKFNLETFQLFLDPLNEEEAELLALENNFEVLKRTKNIENINEYELTSLKKNLDKNNQSNKVYISKLSSEAGSNVITGFKFSKESGVSTIFRFGSNENEKDELIIDYLTPNIHENIIITKHSAGKIFYKYLDWNLLLVLQKSNERNLILTLIKTETGKTFYQYTIKNVDFTSKIFPVFEENSIIVSYSGFNKGVLRNEIFVIEIMKREIEHSLYNLFERFFNFEASQTLNNIDNSNIRAQDLVFMTQIYTLPKKIKGMFVSKSLYNISNKFIILVFENNQIYFLDKNLLSARRPVMMEDKSKPGTFVPDPAYASIYADPEMPAYNQIINLDPKLLLSSNYLDEQIENLTVTPTEFESTFIVCTQGPFKFSCFKIYPDKTFDVFTSKVPFEIVNGFVFGVLVKFNWIYYLLLGFHNANKILREKTRI